MCEGQTALGERVKIHCLFAKVILSLSGEGAMVPFFFFFLINLSEKIKFLQFKALCLETFTSFEFGYMLEFDIPPTDSAPYTPHFHNIFKAFWSSLK